MVGGGGGGTDDTVLIAGRNLLENPARYIFIFITLILVLLLEIHFSRVRADYNLIRTQWISIFAFNTSLCRTNIIITRKAWKVNPCEFATFVSEEFL